MDTSTAFTELLGQVATQFALAKPLLPTYGHLLVSALFPIVVGAHASLSRPSSAAKPKKKDQGDNDHDEDAEDEEDEEEDGALRKMEGLEPSDALMFPLMAGLTLAGLYFLIKWLQDPAILNKILSWYFSQAGTVFAIGFLRDCLLVMRSIAFPSRYSHGGLVYKVKQDERTFIAVNEDSSRDEPPKRSSPLPGFLGGLNLPGPVLKGLWNVRGLLYQKATFHAYVHKVVDFKTRFGVLNIISGIIALAAVSYFTFVTKPWWLTNFLGFSFSYGALQFMSPTTFWTGSLILSSLFFYDIYFVFFTPLMVTVATKLDIPIKLLFPRPSAPGDDPDIASLAMLGLGDVVIPGMMIGLALRFDIFLYYHRKQKLAQGKEEATKPQYQNATGGWGERLWTSKATISSGSDGEASYHDAKSFPKTYFYAGIIGYSIGMVTTLLVMQFSNHAQPALLYLVPGVLISLWGTGFLKGDIKLMWAFSDAEEDEEEEDADKKKINNDEKYKDEKPSKKKWSEHFLDYIYGEDRDGAKKNAAKPEDAKSKEEEKEDQGDGPSSEKEKPKTDEQETKDNPNIISFAVSLPKKQKSEQKPQDKISTEEPTPK